MAKANALRKEKAGGPQSMGGRQAASASDLDRLIHERMRLGIVSALAVNESLTFNDLKKLLNTTDGNISVQEGINHTDSVRGKLRLVSFADAQKLLKEGYNLFAQGEAGAAQADPKSTVQQGYVEKSNVNTVSEMSRMVEVMRTYQQIATLLQQQSDLHKSAIDKLADVPT